MQTVFDKIEKAHFVVSADQVEALAAQQHTNAALAQQAGVTYLRVIIACTLALVQTKRKAAVGTTIAGLNKVHKDMYAAVIRGVTTPDLEKLEEAPRNMELNRRAAFARSATSTVRTFVRGGGDLRNVDLAAVSKTQLYQAGLAPEPTERNERIVQRSEARLIKALQRKAKSNPAWTGTHIKALIEELRSIASGLEPKAARVLSHRVRRVSQSEASVSH